MDRTEYLKRPLIKGVIYRICPDHIRIYNDNTQFINVINCHRIALEDIERRFAELKRIIKTAGNIKLKDSTKFIPAVRALYPKYNAACDDIERLFTEICKCVETMQKEGLHVGCIDDDIFQSALQKSYEINRYYYRSSAYSRLLNYNTRLREIMKNQRNGNHTIYKSVKRIFGIKYTVISRNITAIP